MVLEAIKKGFEVAAKSMNLVLVLIIFNVIFNIIGIPLAPKAGTEAAPTLTPAALIFSAVFILISVFIQGGSLALIRDSIKEGKLKLGNFASYGLKYYLRLLGLGAIIILLVSIVAIIAGLMIIAATPLNNVVATTVAVIIAVTIVAIVAVLYFIPFTLAPYTLVCEETGIIEALKKSLMLMKNKLPRVFMLVLLFVLLILIALGIGFIIGFIAGLITAVLPVGAGQILMAVVTSIINGYLGVVMMAAFMTFYLALVSKDKAVV